jgi:hypothetical protein
VQVTCDASASGQNDAIDGRTVERSGRLGMVLEVDVERVVQQKRRAWVGTVARAIVVIGSLCPI